MNRYPNLPVADHGSTMSYLL